MSEQESGDSDHEGFIPNLLEIKPCFRQPEDKTIYQHLIFQPHCIEGTPLLRKEVKQCYQHFHNIPIPQKSSQVKSFNRVKPQLQRQSAFQKYSNISSYVNVYSRYKEPLSNGQRLFENEVQLKQAFSSGKSHIYRNLREPGPQKNIQISSSSLIFDSKFESGNLISAFRCQKQSNTYQLMMQSDTNTYGYSQWFYFSIKNAKPNVVYTFKIVNFKKRYSFFKTGMKPLVFSLLRANKSGNGWYRQGQNVQFYESGFKQSYQTFYTLEFQISFQHENDYITLSPYPPYSYSKLMHSLKFLQQQALKKDIYFQLKSAARTLGGNNVPYLKCSKTKDRTKPAIVIMARQHSGQTFSSYLLEEILRFLLLQNTDEGNWLLQTYNLHIFPMINVDGVIYGNFRCDLAGYDLNRCWKDPSSTIHPQNYKIKQILEVLSEESEIQVCLDLHTHSKDLGVFAYCCSEGQAFRVVPSLISKLTSLFRYRACTFGITKYKQTTARAFLYELSKSSSVITIEMSTFGFKDYQTKSLVHFSTEHVKSLAKAIVQSIYYNTNGVQPKNNNKGLVNQADAYTQEQSSPISGSDSQPQADEIQLKKRLKKILPRSIVCQILVKKRKLNKKTMNRFRNTEKMHVKTASQTEKEMQNSRYPPKPDKANYSVKNKEINSNSFSIQSSPIKKSPQNKSSASKSFRPFQFSVQFPLATYTQSKFFKNRNVQVEKQKTSYQPLNSMDFSLKKLPIFASDTLPDSYKRILNQNQSLILATMALPNKFTEQRTRGQKKNSAHSTFSKGQISNYINVSEQKKQVKNIEQFPFLCIMSQNKRQAHLQRIRERRQKKAMNRTHGEIDSTVQQLESQCVQRKFQNQSILRRLVKEKNFINMGTVSQKWAQNSNKYKMNIKKT